jgi:hypothetical protein
MDANKSISGSCRSVSSAKTATAVIEKEMNAAAVARQQLRMKSPQSQNPD